MSLLLDALKRAEQEKLTRQGDRPNGAADSAPKVVMAHAAANAPSAAALELQPLYDAAGGVSAARASDAHAAQAVFRAKASQAPGRNRGMLWAGIGAGAVILLAIAAYVWYSINSLTLPVRMPTRAPRPAPIAPPASDANAPRTDLPFVPLSAPADSGGATAGAGPALGAAGPGAAGGAPAAAAPSTARSAVDELLAQPAASAPDPVRLTRVEETVPRIPPDVQAGYRALVAGDLTAARARYTAALAADATNIDALLGLATVLARDGDAAAAAQRYRRVLDMDSQNATAIAGLAALADYGRPDAVESELRGDLARHPGSAALHFALGNVYARQSRWGEAQAEYFEAFRIDPSSPDIAFNLAVSLDHIGQRRPAADYYRRALAAARGSPRQFDPGEAQHRLAELEQR